MQDALRRENDYDSTDTSLEVREQTFSVPKEYFMYTSTPKSIEKCLTTIATLMD